MYSVDRIVQSWWLVPGGSPENLFLLFSFPCLSLFPSLPFPICWNLFTGLSCCPASEYFFFGLYDPFSMSRLASSSPSNFLNDALMQWNSATTCSHLPTLLYLCISTGEEGVFPHTLDTLCWASMPSAPCFSLLKHSAQMPSLVKPSLDTSAAAPQNFKSPSGNLNFNVTGISFCFTPWTPPVEWVLRGQGLWLILCHTWPSH